MDQALTITRTEIEEALSDMGFDAAALARARAALDNLGVSHSDPINEWRLRDLADMLGRQDRREEECLLLAGLYRSQKKGAPAARYADKARIYARDREPGYHVAEYQVDSARIEELIAAGEEDPRARSLGETWVRLGIWRRYSDALDAIEAAQERDRRHARIVKAIRVRPAQEHETAFLAEEC